MSRKKSVAAHLENATYRPSVHGARTAPLPASMPTRPRGLPPKVARVWGEFARLLRDRLRPEDGPLLLTTAQWFATMQAAHEALAGETAGTLVYARALSAVSIASQRFEACAKRLGMSPIDREQMSIPDPSAPKVVRW